MTSPPLRNIAIVAHVDHGKTTLVDVLLRQSGLFRKGQDVAERVMDSHDLERERGITIFSKNAACTWRDIKINIIDTPGHADFGGEVERILRMADGVLLVVDAFEGPMPQTRFVLSKALEVGLAPMVMINKVDRRDARPEAVEDETGDLFLELATDESQLDYPVVYGSARDGWAVRNLDDPQEDMTPVLDAMVGDLPAPTVEPDAPPRLLVSSMDWSDYVGSIAIGRLDAGTLAPGAALELAGRDGSRRPAAVERLEVFEGLGRREVDRVEAGDICAITGLGEVSIGDWLLAEGVARPPVDVTVEEPTLSLHFRSNDSPLRGQEGEHVSSRRLHERLRREPRQNLALRVTDTDEPDTLEVAGRGLLHLGILVETLRREGYEFQVGRPRVLTRETDDGVLEPVEEVIVDVPADHAGAVIELLGTRKGEMESMTTRGEQVRLLFHAPSRGLIGLRSRLLTATRGEAIMHGRVDGWQPWRGDIPGRRLGSLVSMISGKTAAFALWNLQERGTLFVQPGEPVYEGQVVGEHSRENDLPVNPCKAKKLTNIRAAGSDESIQLTPPRRLEVETALEYVADDELVEFTPTSIRLRKRLLREHERKKAAKRAPGTTA